MKQIWVAVMLALFCGNVAAKRILVDDVDEFVAYADTDTIERIGSAPRMVVLYDYKVKHTYLSSTYWSQRSMSEYDCRGRRTQILQYALHAGQMGGGEIVLSGAILPGLWSPVPPGSVVEKFWKVACSN